ncbi:MAG: tetratricopeptide repeat protein [Thermoplasmata archaeon]
MEIPFVGREKELDILRNALEKTRDTGAGNVYIITGQMGVGKTRLIQEVSKTAEKMGYAIMLGRGLDEKAVPFLPLIEAFEKYSTKPEETSKYVPTGLIGAEIEEREELIGFTREKIRMMEAIMRRFSEISKKQPVMLILDDIQWADTGTLSVFLYLARNVRNLNLILVGAYPDDYVRIMSSPHFEEFLSNLAIEKNVNTIYLHPLKREDISKILGAILGTWKIPEEFVEFVFEKTGGNPLFVEEVGRTILEKGIFDLKARRLKIPVENLEIPDSMKTLVSTRLKVLDENEMRVLGIAAVIGRVFEYAVLRESAGIEEDRLLDTLEKLVNMGIFEQMADKSERFRFLHSVVYDVVYSGLTSSRKRVFHKKVGEILERMHGTDVKFHGELGRHFMIAGLPEKSGKYFISIAEHSLRNFALRECITYCEKVLEISPGILEENIKTEFLGKAQKMLGDCFRIFGELKKAITYYEEAIKNTREEKDRAELYIKMSEACYEIGDAERALALLESARNIFEGINSRDGLARLLIAQAMFYSEIGELERAREGFEKSMELCTELDEKILGDCCYGMGRLFIDLGELDKAEEYLSRALEIRQRYNQKEGVADVYNGLAIIAHDKGELERSLHYYEIARRIYEELGDLIGICRVNNNLAVLRVQRGEMEKAMELYQKNIEISERTGDLSMLMFAYRNIAWAHTFKKEFERSAAFYEKALEIARKIGDKAGITTLLNRIAEAYANMGKLDMALECAEESLKVAEALGSKTHIGEAKWSIADVHIEAKNYAEAERILLEVLALYRSLGNPSYVKDVEYDLARVYAATGKIEEAKKLFNSTLEFYRKLGASGVVKIIEEELGKLEGKDGG